MGPLTRTWRGSFVVRTWSGQGPYSLRKLHVLWTYAAPVGGHMHHSTRKVFLPLSQQQQQNERINVCLLLKFLVLRLWHLHYIRTFFSSGGLNFFLKLCHLPPVKNADFAVTYDNDKLDPCSCLSVVKFLRACSDCFALSLHFPKLAHTAFTTDWGTVQLRYRSRPWHIWIMSELLFLWHCFPRCIGPICDVQLHFSSLQQHQPVLE